MDLQTAMANALTFNAGFVNKALEGLSDADLLKSPSEDTNPIGWTLWHQYRVEDAILSNIGGNTQTWIDAGWHKNFGMEANPGQMGGGDSLEQVKAFRPTVDNIKGYSAAVREKTLNTLKSLPPEDLDKEFPGPGGTPRKAGELLGILMVDHFQHSGQVCYLRGYVTPGWAPF